MESFVFPGILPRVLFGAGTISEVPREVKRLGRARAFVVSTRGQAAAAGRLAETLGGELFAGAVMHTPVGVTEIALAAFKESGADCIVALGGGSAIGLGKAVATGAGVAQIVVPTTYAGSEMTDILGETTAEGKVTRREPSIRPQTVIYDVDLTLSLSPGVSVVSGFNALAHAAEGLYAHDRNPVITLMAREAIRLFTGALPDIVRDPGDRDARTRALRGAWLASTVLGGASMALHHKLCHVLGGSFGLPHAETHTVILPHVVSFNAPAAMETLGDLTGAGLYDLAAALGAPLSLRDLGLGEGSLERAADLAVQTPYANPRPFSRSEIRALLQDAWAGRRPTA